MLMDDVEAIERTEFAIIDMAIGDVKRATAGEARLGAFILAACIIDYLSCLYAGADGGGEGYRAFIREFFDDKRYNPEDFWTSIRNGLVHNYTVKGGRYFYVDGAPEKHFATTEDGRITLLNLESFTADLERAAESYFGRVKSDDQVRARLIKRISDVGIMTVAIVKIPNRESSTDPSIADSDA